MKRLPLLCMQAVTTLHHMGFSDCTLHFAQAAELLRDIVQEQKSFPQPNCSEVWQYRLGEALHLAGDYKEEEKVPWDAAKSLAFLQVGWKFSHHHH